MRPLLALIQPKNINEPSWTKPVKKSLKGSAQSVVSPLAAAVISVDVELGQAVVAKQIIATVESMKMQTQNAYK